MTSIEMRWLRRRPRESRRSEPVLQYRTAQFGLVWSHWIDVPLFFERADPDLPPKEEIP